MFLINSISGNGDDGGVLSGFESNPGANLIVSNLLRTGNPVIDITIAILLPFVLKLAFNVVYFIALQIYQSLSFGDSSTVDRVIEYELIQNEYGNITNDDANSPNGRNEIIQKAISMYLGTKKTDMIDKAKRARLNLQAVKEISSFDQCSYTKTFGTTSEQLQAYKLTPAPLYDSWIEIEDGLYLKQTKKENNGNNILPDNSDQGGRAKSFKTVIQFTIRSKIQNHELAKKQIARFVQEAYDWYINQMKAAESGARYFYTPIWDSKIGKSKPGSSDDSGSVPPASLQKYQRYKLSSEKTFDSLFFPTKTKVLRLLNSFSKKDGKYKIPGFPHKLGLMLYGPPGTGKTSTIKAIANLLNRNIVNIPLSRVKTNQQLMDLLYSGVYEVGEDMPVKLGLEDVVYVIEDIDCASKIVHSRKKNKTENTSIPPPGSLSRDVSMKSNDGVDALENMSPEDLKKAMMAFMQQKQQTDGAAKPADGDGSDDDDNNGGKIGGLDKATLALNFSKLFKEPDELNLSGILNAIDGVVDSPGRVIIITTNHPEKLDQALIRPGRIDHIIHLGYIKYEQVVQMVTHYFLNNSKSSKEEGIDKDIENVSTKVDKSNEIPPDLLKRIRACFPSNDEIITTGYINRTPAEIECKCAECETIEEFVESIESDDGTSRTKFESW